jgi:hypothetical protein
VFRIKRVLRRAFQRMILFSRVAAGLQMIWWPKFSLILSFSCRVVLKFSVTKNRFSIDSKTQTCRKMKCTLFLPTIDWFHFFLLVLAHFLGIVHLCWSHQLSRKIGPAAEKRVKARHNDESVMASSKLNRQNT